MATDDAGSTGIVGHNIVELKKDIANAIAEINQAKAERKNCNDRIAEIRSKLETKGIHKQAFDMALKYLNMDADKREGFDIAYAIVREAGGLPLQDDLLSAA
jgi:hypothetical protein